MRLEFLQSSLASRVIIALLIYVSCSAFSERKERPVIAPTRAADQIEKTSTPSSPIPPRPQILSRQVWKANDAIGKMQSHTIQHITVHHTASPQKSGVALEKKMQSLQRFSQSESRLASGKIKPAWGDVPYHFYIAANGQIAEGREIEYVGDTNTDYDPRGHALIVLEGNFENEQPSTKQLESLRELVAWLSAKYEIPVAEIKGHNDYASTACPGVNLKKELPALRQRVAEIRGLR